MFITKFISPPKDEPTQPEVLFGLPGRKWHKSRSELGHGTTWCPYDNDAWKTLVFSRVAHCADPMSFAMALDAWRAGGNAGQAEHRFVDAVKQGGESWKSIASLLDIEQISSEISRRGGSIKIDETDECWTGKFVCRKPRVAFKCGSREEARLKVIAVAEHEFCADFAAPRSSTEHGSRSDECALDRRRATLVMELARSLDEDGTYLALRSMGMMPVVFDRIDDDIPPWARWPAMQPIRVMLLQDLLMRGDVTKAAEVEIQRIEQLAGMRARATWGTMYDWTQIAMPMLALHSEGSAIIALEPTALNCSRSANSCGEHSAPGAIFHPDCNGLSIAVPYSRRLMVVAKTTDTIIECGCEKEAYLKALIVAQHESGMNVVYPSDLKEFHDEASRRGL